MKKIVVSSALSAVMLSGILSAEESGAFVGVDLGIQNAVMTQEQKILGGDTETQKAITFGNFRYGLMGGYKLFFNDDMGVRFYASVSNGNNVLANKAGTFDALNVFANADFLYNLFNEGDNSFGLFAGVSLGYSIYSGGVVKKNSDEMKEFFGKELNPSGFDAGINFGVRGVVAKNHGVELFTRFGIYHTQAKIGNEFVDIKMWIDQPYSFGARYVFNF